MVEYYIELTEDTEDLWKPFEHTLLYIQNEEEAEIKYTEEGLKFTKPFKAKMVEMNHDKDGKENKPCRIKEFDLEGKLEKEWK